MVFETQTFSRPPLTLRKMGGPVIAKNAKKWVDMTEAGLLREIQKDGNPRIAVDHCIPQEDEYAGETD